MPGEKNQHTHTYTHTGEGTEIIDHHMDLAENFYKPATPVPLETILEHEAKREHLHIYRSKPEKLPQLWEGGIPRFVRAPLHMTFNPLESRNQEMAPGPVLHDTRTGIAIRVLGQMTPSPERAVQEDQLRDKLRIAAGRAAFWGWMFVFAFLFKFMAYMSLRTKLRTQGISNPILPQNRIKTLEIMWFARNNFKQYRAFFKEFSELHWIPYRQAQLAKDAAVGERDTKALMMKLEAANIAQSSEQDDGLWGSVKRLFGFGAPKEVSKMRTVFVKEMGESYEIDTTRAVIGMSPDGPVYATPDTEVLYPDQLKAKMSSLKTKVTTQMDSDLKAWSAESYDKRARDHADEFVVQFHQFLRDKGVITPLDPATVRAPTHPNRVHTHTHTHTHTHRSTRCTTFSLFPVSSILTTSTPSKTRLPKALPCAHRSSAFASSACVATGAVPVVLRSL